MFSRNGSSVLVIATQATAARITRTVIPNAWPLLPVLATVSGRIVVSVKSAHTSGSATGFVTLNGGD